MALRSVVCPFGHLANGVKRANRPLSIIRVQNAHEPLIGRRGWKDNMEIGMQTRSFRFCSHLFAQLWIGTHTHNNDPHARDLHTRSSGLCDRWPISVTHFCGYHADLNANGLSHSAGAYGRATAGIQAG